MRASFPGKDAAFPGLRPPSLVAFFFPPCGGRVATGVAAGGRCPALRKHPRAQVLPTSHKGLFGRDRPRPHVPLYTERTPRGIRSSYFRFSRPAGAMPDSARPDAAAPARRRGRRHGRRV